MTDDPAQSTSHPSINGASTQAKKVRKYYFIAWRWHFYAGLYVIPFLAMLAITGLIMLWISWNAGVSAERMDVNQSENYLAASELQSSAKSAVPDASVSQYIEPLAEDKVALFVMQTNDGNTGVVLNPYTGDVLKTFPWRAGWYDFANDIHATLLIGTLGDRLIEIAASLAIVLIATGLYLHWPRNGVSWRQTLLPRFSQSGRLFWKSLHGTIGFWLSAFLLIFLLSGLSWAGIWGGKFVQPWNTFPAEKNGGSLLSDKTHADMNHDNTKEVPWTLEQTPMPASGSLYGSNVIQPPVNLDNIVTFGRRLQFDGRFQVNLPQDSKGVWTISHDSMSNDGPDPSADRNIHIDQYTGNVLADVRYADYSPYAKAMAWGIAFHEGDMGFWNLILNTLVCLSIILMSITGLMIWWMRRPKLATTLVAPPKPDSIPFWKGAALLVIVLGIAFPMAGLAIAAVLIFDRTLLKLLPSLKRVVS